MRRIAPVLTFATLSLVAVTTGSASAQSCDRRCLATSLDTYLSAMVNHDPAAARLAPNFRYTENAVVVKAADGLWRTATKLGAVQRRYFDPASGQAAFFGLVEEGTGGGIATLRIKVAGRQVIEGELIIGRRVDGVYDPAGLIANAPVERTVPAAAQTSRDDMIKAADSYFSGLESKNSGDIAARAGCLRVENGVVMTGVREGRAGAAPVDRGDCANMSAMGQIAAVVHRRFPVVDVEAGVVVGMGVFNRPPGARRANGTLWPRNLLTEIFTIDAGRITAIHAAMHYLEPDVPNAPGW